MAELVSVKKPTHFKKNWNLPTITTETNCDSVDQSTAVVTLNRGGKSEVHLSWANLSFTTKEGKVILKDLSGNACPGEMLAIMGPSGAGKTTLLNALSGFIHQKDEGKVYVNGKEREISQFRKSSCYIMQEEEFLGHFTVQETMNFAASLKIPTSVPRSEKDKIVDDAIQTLSLADTKNTKVLCLSGGERRRLSIAQQLISNPHVIFLDEPTSGLDSSSCLQCIKLLKSLAEKGRTIISTIHQPSTRIFEMFDKLYMLADGQCLFRGFIEELIPFLSNQGFVCPKYHNPSDFITEIASGELGDFSKLTNLVSNQDKTTLFLQPNGNRSSLSLLEPPNENGANKSTLFLVDAPNNDKQQENKYTTSSCHQFKALFLRSLQHNFKNPILSYVRLGVQIVTAVFLGLLYIGVGTQTSRMHESAFSLFFALMLLSFDAMMTTVMIFPIEKNVVIREHQNSWYSIPMYYFGKTISGLPFQIIYPVIFASILYWMGSQPNEMFRFGLFLLACVISPLCAESIAIFVGACTSAQIAVYIAPIVTVPFFIFSGAFVSTETMTPYLRWVTYLSYMRYSFHSAVQAVYGFDRETLECEKDFCPYTDPKKFMADIGASDFTYEINIVAQITYCLILRIGAFFLLQYKLRVSRNRA